MTAPASRRLATLLLVASCGFVDEVARTDFQLPEAKFRVAPSAERPLTAVVDLEREIRLAPADVGGSSNLDDVSVEDVVVAVYANSLPVAISSVTFIVEPLDPVTRTALATIEAIAAESTDWPAPTIDEAGRTQLGAFIGAPQASFRLLARVVFDLDDSQLVDDGTLDIRLRIHASALAAR